MMFPTRWVRRIAGGLATVLLATGPGAAAEPAPGPTREELLQRWDLDGDGSISKSEADISRARMRRTRLELQLGAGIDPLTGLPRGDAGAETSANTPTAEPLFQLPPEPPPSQPSRTKPDSLPGLRTPATRPPTPAGPTSSRPPAATPGGRPSTATLPQPLSARASWLPPQRLAPTATGGVRAGAPAAVPGYGSGAWNDLNAGRRPAPAEGPADATRKPSGGLLPTGRPPGRTGAIILPPLPGRPAAALPQAPAARPTPTPRITADEIGAERP
jgi:hypothetical protein